MIGRDSHTLGYKMYVNLKFIIILTDFRSQSEQATSWLCCKVSAFYKKLHGFSFNMWDGYQPGLGIWCYRDSGNMNGHTLGIHSIALVPVMRMSMSTTPLSPESAHERQQNLVRCVMSWQSRCFSHCRLISADS